MTGPYKVSKHEAGDHCVYEIDGPTPCTMLVWDDEFSSTAKDVCAELNLARQQAIAECVGVVEA